MRRHEREIMRYLLRVSSDREDAATNAEASAQLRVTVKDSDPKKVGRAFSNAVIEMALASYPGFSTTSMPTEAGERRCLAVLDMCPYRPAAPSQ